jgi:hypothetical protein
LSSFVASFKPCDTRRNRSRDVGGCVRRSSVEKTLNALLGAEADQICRAQRDERSPERTDTRAWGKRRYLRMETLLNPAEQESAA